MLDFHLKVLQQAGLIELNEGIAGLAEYGRNFLKGKEERPGKRCRPLTGQTCRGYRSKAAFALHSGLFKYQDNCKHGSTSLRVLKVLESIFPRGRYSDEIGALMME